MKKGLLALAVLLSASLGACTYTLTELHNAVSVVEGSYVSPEAVFVIGNSFDAIEASATNYISLRKCSSTSGPVCRNQKATVALIKAIRAGRKARNALENFMIAHPGALGPAGLYNAVVTSLDTIRSIMASYNIGVTR